MGIILNEKGEVLRSYTGKNANATDNRWLFQAELAEKDDPQTVERHQHAGFTSRAPVGSKLIITKITDSYLVSVAEYDGIVNSDLNEGDSRLYSTSAGAAQVLVTALATGALNIVAPNKVIVDTDIIANLVSLFEHKHIDSWGKPTSAPLAQGAPTPAVPTTVIVESDIDMNTNSKTIDGVDVDAHNHDVVGVTVGVATITSGAPN